MSLEILLGLGGRHIHGWITPTPKHGWITPTWRNKDIQACEYTPTCVKLGDCSKKIQMLKFWGHFWVACILNSIHICIFICICIWICIWICILNLCRLVDWTGLVCTGVLDWPGPQRWKRIRGDYSDPSSLAIPSNLQFVWGNTFQTCQSYQDRIAEFSQNLASFRLQSICLVNSFQIQQWYQDLLFGGKISSFFILEESILTHPLSVEK